MRTKLINPHDFYYHPELSEDDEMPSLKREANPNWKGGKYKDSRGYVRVLCPFHPRASSKGYIKESILIAEKALGKPLPQKAVVHHHDEKQLVICQDQSYHRFIHMRQKALNVCGDSHKRLCRECQIWFPLNQFSKRRWVCKKCSIKLLRRWINGKN